MTLITLRLGPAYHNEPMPQHGVKTDAGTLFEAYHDGIYRYLLHMVKNPAQAQDLTQDTFLLAHRSLESLRDPDAVRGWLYRIATRACVDRLRRRRLHVPLEADEDANQSESATSKLPSAEEIVGRKETSACVQRCLDFLPDSYRAVILLYEAQSLTVPEIARLLGVSASTVKIRLHRARRKLQQVMTKGCCVSQDRNGVPVCQPKV